MQYALAGTRTVLPTTDAMEENSVLSKEISVQQHIRADERYTEGNKDRPGHGCVKKKFDTGSPK